MYNCMLIMVTDLMLIHSTLLATIRSMPDPCKLILKLIPVKFCYCLRSIHYDTLFDSSFIKILFMNNEHISFCLLVNITIEFIFEE